MPTATTALSVLVTASVLAATCAAPGAATGVATGVANPDVAGRVTPTGAMRHARAAHTATALPDGRVLVAGGFGGSDAEGRMYATTELFDPVTASFAAGPRMRVGRTGHSATTLRDGRVLVAGGWTGQFEAARDAELFDPRTNAFSPAGAMTEPRADQTATLLADGRVLIAGGYDPHMGALASAEIYDPATSRFAPVAPLAAPRALHTATLLADGRVLVAGGGAGRGAARTLHAVVELFDPARGTFTPAGRMLAPRHKHAAARLPDGSVLVVGGSDARDWDGRMASAERFDPSTGRFAFVGRTAAARFKLSTAVVALRDGRVLVAGGDQRAEVYDPARGAFAPAAGSFGAARFLAAAAALPNGAVLVTGGYARERGGLPATALAHVYRP